jgi:hypothetical protein
MRSRTTLAVFALLGLSTLLLPGKVQAQSITSPYQFLGTNQEGSLFAGYQSMGTGRFGFGPGPGMAFGGVYGVNFAGPFGLEGVVTYLPTTRDIVDPGRDKGDLVVGDMSSDMIMIDGRLRFALTGDRTWHGFSPFIVVGGGFAFDVSQDELDKELLLSEDVFNFGTSFIGVLGGGLRWFPGERFVVRADADLVLWQLETPAGFSDPERAFIGVDEEEWVSGSSFSLGLGIRF